MMRMILFPTDCPVPFHQRIQGYALKQKLDFDIIFVLPLCHQLECENRSFSARPSIV